MNRTLRGHYSSKSHLIAGIQPGLIYPIRPISLWTEELGTSLRASKATKLSWTNEPAIFIAPPAITTGPAFPWPVSSPQKETNPRTSLEHDKSLFIITWVEVARLSNSAHFFCIIQNREADHGEWGKHQSIRMAWQEIPAWLRRRTASAPLSPAHTSPQSPRR